MTTATKRQVLTVTERSRLIGKVRGVVRRFYSVDATDALAKEEVTNLLRKESKGSLDDRAEALAGAMWRATGLRLDELAERIA